jgi:hypothetical protein
VRAREPEKSATASETASNKELAPRDVEDAFAPLVCLFGIAAFVLPARASFRVLGVNLGVLVPEHEQRFRLAAVS